MMPRFFPASALLVSAFAALLTSCRKPEIRVYLAPKDKPPATAQDTAGDAHDQTPRAERPRPKVTWTLPPGWQEAAPSEVSLASFSVKTSAGEGTITITPLPNLEGQEALVVNMYRQQAGLEPIDQSALGGILQPVEIAGGAGKLLEIDGKSHDRPVRILTAIAHRDGQSWFYRLAGDDALVAAQKPVFLDFLKTVRIESAAAPETTAASTAAAEKPKFNWTVPSGWEPATAGQMQVAKFAVPGAGDARADVTVSVFPSDTGGLAANIKRWRGQLGLPEVDDATATQAAQPLQGGPAGAQLIELKNEPRTLLGAIVPRDGRWFFYKLVGDTPAVAAQREAFVQFAKSQP